MYLLVSLLQLNALVVGNGSCILWPCGHDLHGPIDTLKPSITFVSLPLTLACSPSRPVHPPSPLAPTEVVGTLRHSITYPACSPHPSSLPLAPSSLLLLPSPLAPTEVVGTLKHSITYPSSLPSLPACSHLASPLPQGASHLVKLSLPDIYIFLVAPPQRAGRLIWSLVSGCLYVCLLACLLAQIQTIPSNFDFFTTDPP